MSQYDALREEACAANLEIARLRLAILTWGNASAFDRAAGVFAIKPSGLEYSQLTPESMVVVDLDGKVVAGAMRASSDTKTHLVLYRAFAGIRGVCHSHSPHAVAWAQARRPIPCLGTTHADQTAGEIPCTEMIGAQALERDYELGTGELIVETFKGKKPLEIPMVIVAGHGPFTWGGSAMAAVQLRGCPRGSRAHGHSHVSGGPGRSSPTGARHAQALRAQARRRRLLRPAQVVSDIF